MVMKKTVFNAQHLSCGARMVDFGGWHMPVSYAGTLAEHAAVREDVGLFDVSHMGELRVRGPESLAALQHVLAHVADIGDVHHQLNFVPIPFKNPAHHVNPYVEAKVSDMRVVVHCRATGVDADLLCLKWHEWLEAAGPGVVEMKLGDHRNTTAQASRATITCWPSAASWV